MNLLALSSLLFQIITFQIVTAVALHLIRINQELVYLNDYAVKTLFLKEIKRIEKFHIFRTTKSVTEGTSLSLNHHFTQINKRFIFVKNHSRTFQVDLIGPFPR